MLYLLTVAILQRTDVELRPELVYLLSQLPRLLEIAKMIQRGVLSSEGNQGTFYAIPIQLVQAFSRIVMVFVDHAFTTHHEDFTPPAQTYDMAAESMLAGRSQLIDMICTNDSFQSRSFTAVGPDVIVALMMENLLNRFAVEVPESDIGTFNLGELDT